MPTMADVVSDAKRTAYGSLAEQMNQVANAAAAGADEIVLQNDIEGVQAGQIATCGLNVWYIKSVNTSSKTLRVIPGVQGSPQAEVSQNDFVYLKPRVTDWYVFDQARTVIRSLSSPQIGLFRVASFSPDGIDPVSQAYTVPEDVNMVSLLRVRARYPGHDTAWYDLSARSYKWEPDNNIIRLFVNVPTSSSLEFVYKAPFTAPTSLLSDLEADLGLPPEMHDLPALGTVPTLLRTTESRRAQLNIQGDPRRADEVQAGANASIAREFAREFKDRCNDELARLYGRYPLVKAV